MKPGNSKPGVPVPCSPGVRFVNGRFLYSAAWL